MIFNLLRLKSRITEMSHCYRFTIFPRTAIGSHCTFSYKSEFVIPNAIIEKIARSILTNATVLWLKGNEQCLDAALNLTTLKSVLIDQNEQELADWLDPFTTLTMHNDMLWPHSDPTDVFIKLE